MTQQEERQLIIKDLLPRLEHDVMCEAMENVVDARTGEILRSTKEVFKAYYGHYKLSGFLCNDCGPVIKSFLRPMSSMTEDEKIEYDAEYAYNSKTYNYEMYLAKMIDWLVKHHFDFRNLIERGLALEAPEGMYQQKK